MESNGGKTYLEEYFGAHKDLPVAVIAKECDFSREYMRRLRRAGISARIFAPTRVAEETERIDTEQSRLLVALGGEEEIDCAKYLAALKSLPVFVVAASPAAANAYSLSATVEQNGVLVKKTAAAPEGVAVAAEFMDSSHLPAAFGGICACVLSALDADIYARVTGARPDEQTVNKALDIAYKALDEVKARFRDDPELLPIICDLSIEASRITKSGAADDCARCAAALFKYEGRECRPFGELKFLFGAVLVNSYRELTVASSSFVPPPDNNRRAEILGEYLGWDDFVSARAAVSKLGDIPLASYRLKEYSEELKSEIGDACALFDESRKYFRRLYRDDGFSLGGYLDPSDFRTVLALAPDTFGDGKNALAVMRDLGLLERYL